MMDDEQLSTPCHRRHPDASSWNVVVDSEWHTDKDFLVTCHGLDPGGIDACSEEDNVVIPCVPLKTSSSNIHVYMPVMMLGTAYISANHGAGRDNPQVIEAAPAIEAALFRHNYTGLDLGSQLHPAYANELQVGNLLQQTGPRRRRQEVFLTTKLSPNEHGYASTLRGVQRSLRLLQTDTIDLYLIHHPSCLMADHCEGDWTQSWKAMQDLHQVGALRAIGVSNFDTHLLQHLLDITKDNVPVALLQNRADPLAPEHADVLRLVEEHGIQYQAFSVLGRQWVVGPWSPYWRGTHALHPILNHPQVVAIAQRLSAEMHGQQQQQQQHVDDDDMTISTAQVVLKWALQKGWTVVPKTARSERLESNKRLFHFHLSDSDMHVLDHLQPPPQTTTSETTRGEL